MYNWFEFKELFQFILTIDDLYLLRCLLCGGFTDDLQDSVMWFSNGGTKSVLHFDAIDNINCLMSGTKELFMVDKVVWPSVAVLMKTVDIGSQKSAGFRFIEKKCPYFD